jgi:DNA-binding transcriptional LysR family regulator
MNLNILKYVIAVSEEKSITKASQKLYVAQPSLSQSLRALEEDLGTLLFDRSKSPLQPTAAGEIYINWARDVLISEQIMRNKLSDILSNRQNKLIIGLTPQRNKSIIPTVLHEFYAATTDCSIILKERVSAELEALMEQNSIDLLIDQPNADIARYESVPILNETVLITAPESYVFKIIRPGKYPTISIKELANKPFILLSGNKYIEDTFRELFRHMGQSPSIVLECLSPQVAHTMVSLNTGITLIPEYNIVNSALSNVRYYTLDEYPLSRIVAVTYRKDRPLAEEAAVLISILQEQCAAAVYSDNKNG